MSQAKKKRIDSIIRMSAFCIYKQNFKFFTQQTKVRNLEECIIKQKGAQLPIGGITAPLLLLFFSRLKLGLYDEGTL